MKALVYTGPEKVELRDVAEPEAREGDVVVKVDAVGVCGSDMHAFLGHDERRPAPLVLGHEASGVVVRGPGEGRRVAIDPLVTCGHCDACLAGRSNLCPDRQIISMPPREGAFAELVVVPERNAIELPADLAFPQAALTEPMACSYHAVRLAAQVSARPLAEACAAVLGGGAIGLGAALALADFGCADVWIAEPNRLRHDRLRRAGDFRVFDPDRDSGPQAGRVDVIVDAFGGEASRAAACALCRPGGVVVHIGLASGAGGLDVRRMTLQEITFVGAYTFTRSDFRETLKAISAGRLGALDWMDECTLDDGPAMFRNILSGKASHPKTMFRL